MSSERNTERGVSRRRDKVRDREKRGIQPAYARQKGSEEHKNLFNEKKCIKAMLESKTHDHEQAKKKRETTRAGHRQRGTVGRESVCVWPKEYTQRGRGRNSQSDSTHTRTHTFYLDSPNHTHKYRDGERRNTTPEASLSNNVKAQRLIAQEPCFPSMKEYLPARNTTESIRKVVQISQIKGL